MIFKFLLFNIIYTTIIFKIWTHENLHKSNVLHSNLHRRHLKEFTTCIERLGCINTTKEWYHDTYRPRNLEPLARHTIRTEFILITKDAKDNNDEMALLNYETLILKKESIQSSGYKRNMPLTILIHDFTSNGYTGWIKHLASSLLCKKLKSNVVSVDWEAGAEPPFEQAIANARVVALEILAFINILKSISPLSTDSLHIIGHGVGTHIAGYVGNSTSIRKITGLDPTGPFFEGMSPIVRLDPGDASYVEVLHTDAFNSRSQGCLKPLGHVDFYLNGAKLQPNCNESSRFPKFTKVDRTDLKAGQILPACSHKRAFKYYIEALDSEDCEFTGIRCASYEKFFNGKCTSCNAKENKSSCATFASANITTTTTTTPTSQNTFYLNTGGDSPFCMNSYRVNIRFTNNENAKRYQDGTFELMMINDNGIMVNASVNNANSVHTFQAGLTYNLVYYAPSPKMRTIVEARLKWLHKPNSLCVAFCNTAVYVDRVNIILLSATVKYYPENYLCAANGRTKIENGSYIVYKKCTETPFLKKDTTFPAIEHNNKTTEVAHNSTC